MTTINTAPARISHAAAGQLFFGPRVEMPVAVADRVSVDDVCDLLAAAGPLTVRDIAGGLAVPARQAASCVRRMVRERSLRRDEFGRYRLSGSGAMR